jgi:hypothetical protein
MEIEFRTGKLSVVSCVHLSNSFCKLRRELSGSQVAETEHELTHSHHYKELISSPTSSNLQLTAVFRS